MDPSATLFTFMLQTHPSVQTVTVVGSWDNFSQHYPMERDSRRGQGQWRGCHALQTLPNETGFAVNKRGAGLRMGQTYHYYYEVNGTTETHDPKQPTTTTCPSLPGQTVNTLEVPIEQTLRERSVSMNNLRVTDFKTMDPKHKYVPPMPPRPPPVAPGAAEVRVGSAPAIQLMRKRSARSLSPNPKWTGAARRIFGSIRPSSREGNGQARTLADWDADASALENHAAAERARSTTPTSSARFRDISPESLRRFLLAEETPLAVPPKDKQLAVWINDDLDDNDDDDNFATTITSPTMENMPFTTLSPPPFMRSISSQLPQTPINESLVATGSGPAIPRSVPFPKRAKEIQLQIPRSRFMSRAESVGALSPVSHTSVDSRGDMSQSSFFDDSDDEIDSRRCARPSLAMKPTAFTGYRLPQPAADNGSHVSKEVAHMSMAFGSPSIIAQAGDDISLGHRNVLGLPQIDESGLGDLADDISWISGLIQPKHI